jgi:hypothetical protein
VLPEALFNALSHDASRDFVDDDVVAAEVGARVGDQRADLGHLGRGRRVQVVRQDEDDVR